MKTFHKKLIIIALTLFLIPFCVLHVSATDTEHVHRFGNPQFKRHANNTWTAYFFCNDYCGFSTTLDCQVYTEYGKPTCLEHAYNTHYISIEFNGNTYTDRVSDYLNPLGHDYVDGRCSRCGIKPLAKLSLPESVTVDYSGEPHYVTLNNADEITGTVIYKYYIDDRKMKETTPENSGAVQNGGAPVYPGKYYVCATYLEDDNFRESTSALCKLIIKPEPVEELKVSNQKDGVLLSWTYYPDAYRYYLYYLDESGKYRTLCSIDDPEVTSCLYEGAPTGKSTYNVTVLRRGAPGVGAVESDLRPEGEVIYHTRLSISNTSSGAKLSWKKISQASGYYIYRKTKGQSKYYKVKTITKNSTLSWTDTSKKSISNGRKSTYYVIPYFKKSTSGEKKSATITNYFLSRPKPWASGRTLDWSTNKSASGYEIKKEDRFGYTSTYTRTSSKYTNFWPKKSSLDEGKVRAYKKVNGVYYYSAWSKTVKDKRLPKQLR